MGIFDVLSLICGVSLFLFGMNAMCDALKKSAGNRLKTILGQMTSKPLFGFLLGLGVTAIIQSSSATTVMVVGFVNSAAMTLTQAIPVVMGAKVGTAVTSWLTGLSGLGAGGAAISSAVQWLKPSAWIPVMALAGISLQMFAKRERKKDVGTILLSFSVLMVGMDMMSEAVGGLKESESFRSILTLFTNPLFGVMAGLVLTLIIQSSSASIGILQSLSTTGAVTYGAALPIIMGMNIGTCVTAIISSIGANKDGKRIAFAHLYFNVFGAVIFLGLFYILDAVFSFAFVSDAIGMWGIATVHTLFNILSVIFLFPFRGFIEKISILTFPDKKEKETANLLDDRLMDTPAVAVARAKDVTKQMAQLSCQALAHATTLVYSYDEKQADLVRDYEARVDVLEDALGTYLIKLSSRDLAEEDGREITQLLHLIGDFERISDHAVNIVESAEEIRDKKLQFSKEAQKELTVMMGAINEIIGLAYSSFSRNDRLAAVQVEPLEEIVDELRDRIKRNHVLRLQKSECTIEHGFVLSDLLNNFERVSDHCSNIAGCMVEIQDYDALNMHQYISSVKDDIDSFEEKCDVYRKKYAL